MEARSGGLDGVHDVGSGADSVAQVDAEADARIQVLDSGEHVKGRGKVFVLGAVVVDGELDVVFLDEFFEARQVRVGGSADGDGDASGLEVFELGTDVGVVVLVEGDVAVGGENKSGGAIGGGPGGDLRSEEHTSELQSL